MNIFNVKDFLKLRNDSYTIENIPFEMMSLTTEQTIDLKACESYIEMLDYAANYGLAIDGKRVIDDEYMAARLDALWETEELEIDSDPCIQYRVGEKVCEISGLEDFLKETLSKEEEAERVADVQKEGVINGDGEIPNIPIDTLNNDREVAA